MKKQNLKFAFFIISLVFQLACEQTQAVSENTDQNKSKNLNQPTSNSVISNVEEKKEINYFAHLKPEHREVLQEWLKDKSYLRPAVEEIDSILNKSELEDIHKNSRTQFYTVADINKDGEKDFAVILVDTEKKNKFAIAIFNGKFSKGQIPNHFEENLTGVSDSHIEYVNEKDDYFSTDSFLLLSGRERGCGGYIPKKKVYRTAVCI